MLRACQVNAVIGSDAELLAESARTPQERLCYGHAVKPAPVLFERLLARRQIRPSQLPESALGSEGGSGLHVSQPLTGDFIGLLESTINIAECEMHVLREIAPPTPKSTQS